MDKEIKTEDQEAAKKQNIYNNRLNKVLKEQESKRKINKPGHVNLESGEVVWSENFPSTKTPIEPTFIKLYTGDKDQISQLGTMARNVLLLLVEHLPYERYEFSLSSRDRKAIQKKLGYSTIKQVGNAINQLKKAGHLFEVRDEDGDLLRSTYKFNPYLFGKGSWSANFKERSKDNFDALYQL